jgi:hypothetical protein
MHPDHTNYEAWFLDAIEGRLTVAQQEALEVFLRTHPELRAELDEMRGMFGSLTVPLPVPDPVMENRERMHYYSGDDEEQLAPPVYVPYPDRQSLKKQAPVNSEEQMLLLAALAEGDLKGEEERRARGLLTDPAMLQAFDLLVKCRVVPQSDVVFGEKSALYKRPARVVPLMRYFSYAAAAAVAVLLALNIMTAPYPEAEMARRHTPSLKSRSVPNAGSSSGAAEDDGASVPAASSRPRVAEPDVPVYPEQDITPRDVAVIGESPMPEEFQTPPAQEPESEQLAQLPESAEEEPVTPVVRTAQRAEAYRTIFELAEDKTREKLWGGTDYPSEGFALALAQREVQRRFGERAAFVEMSRTETAEKSEWSFRVGKVSVSRKRSETKNPGQQ